MSNCDPGENGDKDRKEDSEDGDKDKKEDSEEVVPKSPSEAFDSLLSSVGNGGRWQWKITLLCGFCGFFTSMHNLGAVFLGATPHHLCDISNTSKYTNTNIDPVFYEEIRNFSTPRVIGKEGDLIPSKCHYIDRELELDELFKSSSDNSWMDATSLYDYDSDQMWENISGKIKCSKWEYDKSTFNTTVVTEWNLVCDDLWLKPTIQATYMLGILTGAVVASSFSDRFGRRPSSIACAILFFFCSVISAFSPYLWMFLFFRFIVAGAGQGMYLINFVIVMEIVGLKKRDISGLIFTLSFPIGTMALAALSYFVTNWRSLQLAMGAPSILLLSYYWLLPESPRWLLMKGKTKAGIAVLEEVGKYNGGKTLPNEEKLKFALQIIDKEVLCQREKYGESFSNRLLEYFENVCKLVRTPNIRRRSCIIFYCWFVVSMSSYGLVFSGENINVSLHLLILINGIFGPPSIALCYFTFMRFGRRITLSYGFIFGGLCCIIILIVPTDLAWIKLTCTIVGRMFMGIAFTSVFFFSTELVPTDIRNISIGMASMFARIGSALAPYIVDLLGEIYYAIPTTIFGLLAIIAGILALWLPETMRHRLPETIAEIEALPR